MVKGITYIIKNDSTCQTLIGQNEAQDTVKVYPMQATQKESLPVVTVWKTGRLPEFCKGQRPTTFNYTYEVHVYAASYDGCEAIMNAVINALEETNVSSAINGVRFTDRIRNVDFIDREYIESYKCYNMVGIFQAPVNEDTPT